MWINGGHARRCFDRYIYIRRTAVLANVDRLRLEGAGGSCGWALACHLQRSRVTAEWREGESDVVGGCYSHWNLESWSVEGQGDSRGFDRPLDRVRSGRIEGAGTGVLCRDWIGSRGERCRGVGCSAAIQRCRADNCAVIEERDGAGWRPGSGGYGDAHRDGLSGRRWVGVYGERRCGCGEGRG